EEMLKMKEAYEEEILKMRLEGEQALLEIDMEKKEIIESHSFLLKKLQSGQAEIVRAELDSQQVSLEEQEGMFFFFPTYRKKPEKSGGFSFTPFSRWYSYP